MNEGEFQPSNIKNQKLNDKFKLIVVPELRRLHKKLTDYKIQDPSIIERECKLSGIPVKSPDAIERLVSL